MGNPNGNNADKNQIVIENIGEALVELIEKYYLIADGKSMMDIVTNMENISLIFNILTNGGPISNCVVNVVTWLIKYYSFSSFNTEEHMNA